MGHTRPREAVCEHTSGSALFVRKQNYSVIIILQTPEGMLCLIYLSLLCVVVLFSGLAGMCVISCT